MRVAFLRLCRANNDAKKKWLHNSVLGHAFECLNVSPVDSLLLLLSSPLRARHSMFDAFSFGSISICRRSEPTQQWVGGAAFTFSARMVNSIWLAVIRIMTCNLSYVSPCGSSHTIGGERIRALCIVLCVRVWDFSLMIFIWWNRWPIIQSQCMSFLLGAP